MNRWLEKKARNEALVREVNERIAEIDQAAEEANLAPGQTLFEFLCECGGDSTHMACDEHIEMTLEEYEDIRLQDDRFAICPGHETQMLESVVVRTDRFLVVDKRPMVEPFVADDPRGAPSS
jgi:hypothetical protein